MTKSLLLFFLAYLATSGHASAASPGKKSGQVLRTPSSSTPVRDSKGNVDVEVDSLAESLPDEPTENVPELSDLEADDEDIFTADKDSQSRTKEITKDIVNESENPEPEFPYPGATEEGFGKKSKKNQNQQQEGPPPNLTKPIRMNSSGEYFYGFKSSEKEAASSIRFGYFGPPDISNPESKKTFMELYGEGQIPTLFFDYEWMLTRKIGDVGIKVTTGLFYSEGTGAFTVPHADRANKTPDEEFKFLMMPNLISFVYRFQYFRNQYIVPFIDGGGGYYTFAELRDDGGNPKYGGVPVVAGAAGMNFQLDWLDTHAIRQLDSEWGINHVWLTTEFRVVKATDETKDVSSSVISGGIMMEF